jgi:2-polyprenyl-3-methyl-5-hydroxy-6-metoxy-1,4-benzoquinol methylase
MSTEPHHKCFLTRSTVAQLVRDIYSQAPKGLIKYKQQLRAYICPFDILINYIRPGTALLDVGCGAGLFILLLARLGRIRSGLGFDADSAAIKVAQDIAVGLRTPSSIRFEFRDVHTAWTEDYFDAVVLIDVIHHVESAKQMAVVTTAARHVAEGGILLYKDIARRPLWRAWANRLHDLLSVGEWVHYARGNDVVNTARAQGLHLEAEGSIDILWYRHEWYVFRRSVPLKGNVQ